MSIRHPGPGAGPKVAAGQNVLLQLRAISKRYGGVPALDGIDLTLRVGEVHCLAGENGCGKSTLIKIVSGVIQPEPGGEIWISGETIPHLTPSESTRRGIQVIYQDLSLFPQLTVAENIAVARHAGAFAHWVNWRAIRATACAAMERIGARLDLEQPVSSLSIANRQLVAICRALAADASLVIMDEPTASLTHREVDALLGVVKDLQSTGITTVFVSHRLDEVIHIADRISVIRDGAKVGTFHAGEIDQRQLAYLMTGKEFDDRLTQAPSVGRELLRVTGLTKQGQFSDVSFSVREGEIVGMTGLLGSGRTELALALFGMNKPDSGEITMEGMPVRMRNNLDAMAHGIGYVPEDRLTQGLVMEQPISLNIVLSTLGDLPRRWGLLDMGALRDSVNSWIAALTIKASNADLPVGTLSGGNQQRVVLARWIATGPKLLILDSPTIGVDINAKHGIYEVMKQLAAKGVAVILISDEMQEVLFHTHRILVMQKGRVVAERLPHETSQAQLRELANA